MAGESLQMFLIYSKHLTGSSSTPKEQRRFWNNGRWNKWIKALQRLWKSLARQLASAVYSQMLKGLDAWWMKSLTSSRSGMMAWHLCCLHCDQMLLCSCFIVVTAWAMVGFVLPTVAIHHLWRAGTYSCNTHSLPPDTHTHTHTHTPSSPRRWEVLSLLLLHLHVHHYINLLVCLIFQNPSLCIWFYEPSGWRNGRTHERLLSELQLVMRGDFTSAALFCMWSSHYVNVMLRMQWPSNFQNGSKILIVEKTINAAIIHDKLQLHCKTIRSTRQIALNTVFIKLKQFCLNVIFSWHYCIGV